MTARKRLHSLAKALQQADLARVAGVTASRSVGLNRPRREQPSFREAAIALFINAE